MKIAVNTRFLIRNKLEGIGVFTYEILKRWCKNHPEDEFIFIFDRKPDPEFIFSPNIKVYSIFPPARHPVLWLIWYEISLHRLLKKIKPDIFISMDGMLPLRTKTKCISVIHDLAFETYPRAVPFMVSLYYRTFFPLYARKAYQIITVSEFSKNDIEKRYNIPAQKIHVVYNGPQAVFKPIDNQQKAIIRQELTGGFDFFLYNGSLHPRKNIDTLLKAFDLFKEKDQQGIRLVIAGRKAWMTKEQEKVYRNMKYRQEVIFTGWLEEQKLADITASALAFIYVSLFEGFGIPVLNAMYCDVPVIVSNTTSLPEVAGEAGLFTDPLNPDELAEKLYLISTDDTLRTEMIAKGRIQREKFGWEDSSEILYKTTFKSIS